MLFRSYVITRIWHLLNDDSIKLITQQYVVRPNGGRALTDLFFPQLKVFIEINEGHHKKQVEEDKMREAGIINAIGFVQLNVDIVEEKQLDEKGKEFYPIKTLEDVNKQIDTIVTNLKAIKNNSTDFKPWNYEKEQNPQTYIDKGFIDVNDDVSFRTIVDAANCFGNNYKGMQHGWAKHGVIENTFLWFPKLYENEGWDNKISDDDSIIYEKSKDKKNTKDHIKKTVGEQAHFTRFVFARVKSPLGNVVYKFKGAFILDLYETNNDNGCVFKRTETRVETFSSLLSNKQ